MRQEGETLDDYAARIAERHEKAIEARRQAEPRFDFECAVFDKLGTLGLENVTEGCIALNPEFTPQYTAQALELTHRVGYELRVVKYSYSRVEVPYAPVMRMRENGAREDVERAAEHAVRQLMIAQAAEAKAWLETHPEPRDDE